MIDPKFKSDLEEKLNAFRVWTQGRNLESCRLVQYTSLECAGAMDVPVEAIEDEIAGAVSEGFFVDWTACGNRVYLCVWEFPHAQPEWAFVMEERDLVDVKALLRAAGFADNE
ncbi:MAG: hypothetical protein ACAI34_12655 [Verrucomicrobium sp.]|nr:hypothetical protein [Verrucomicrobium sp.]